MLILPIFLGKQPIGYNMEKSIDLREIPSIVGGDESKRHGIVLAKSIPAKKYGISTGESYLFS